MSEQEKLTLIEKLNTGLEKSYHDLVRRKAALGENMIIADENGMPISVPAAEILAASKFGE